MKVRGYFGSVEIDGRPSSARLVAIDPGTLQSAVVDMIINDPYDLEAICIVKGEIKPNEEIENDLRDEVIRWRCWLEKVGEMKTPTPADRRFGVVVEDVASYGGRVGETLFETCKWIGRFVAAAKLATLDVPYLSGRPVKNMAVQTWYRRDVTSIVCGGKGSDAEVRKAVIDLWEAGGDPATGTSKKPGPLWGFKKDVWQAAGLWHAAAWYNGWWVGRPRGGRNA